MSDLRVNFSQAQKNMEILHSRYAIYTSDASGNLGQFSKINIFRRVYVWIRSFIDDTETHRVNKTILATLKCIREYSETNPNNPTWTYSVEHGGKDFDIGFDKVAMRILTNEYRFPAHFARTPDHRSDPILINIRKEAYKVMTWATMIRVQRNIDFDCDHV